MTAVIEYEWVNTDERLQALCQQWSRQAAIGLDTEFARSDTFFPHIGLLQIADARGIYLLDPLAFDNTQPLKALLVAPGVTKVIHACSEDLDVFHYYLGVLPHPLFDTQIAAAFCNHGSSIGYARLVHALQEVELPKQETRSDWLQRPLSAAQLRYAALDVEYLLPLYQRLTQSLDKLQRLTWVTEDCEQLLTRFDRDDTADTYFYRIKSAWKLKPHQLAVLQALCAWREHKVRDMDVPRNRIAKDSALFEMALSLPETIKQLRKIKDLRAWVVADFGQLMIACIQQALASAVDYSKSLPAPLDARGRKCLKNLKQTVNTKAESLCMPPEYLVRKKDLEYLVRTWQSSEDCVLPAGLLGWRQAVIGEALLSVLDEQ